MLNLTDFKNKKVLIMGLGLHGGGVGTAAFFAKLGSRVVVTDLKSSRELAPSIAALKPFRNISYHLGRHRTRDFKTADYVIQGPGVPDNSRFLKIAKKAGVTILSDVEIFFLVCPAPIIGITGTKGKSTTASLLCELLGARIGRRSRTAPWVRPSRIKRGSRVWLGGNIRRSVLEFLPRVKRGDLVVLELSSFQLDSLKRQRRSPHIALITNIFPDHLNRYSSMQSYTASKANIFKFQKNGDVLFINARDALLNRLARGAPSWVIRFDPVGIMRRFSKALSYQPPPYQLPSFAAAIAVARHLGVGERAIRHVLSHFRGLPGRMELIRNVNGVEFINDTTATNPTAAREAIAATKRRIDTHVLHVIAGGDDKGLPVTDFVRALRRHAATIIFLPGGASRRMKSEIRNQKSPGLARARPRAGETNPKSQIPKTLDAKTMREAVRAAFRDAKRGDVVLLSPGAASFGLFQHEFDRGEQFIRAIRRLIP